MMRFILPIILVAISVSLFFMFTNPIMGDISGLRADAASYNEALDNSKALENARDTLTAKYNSINSDNLTKLEKLLPQNVDNIRLILEIEQVASPYGMVLKDVKYDATSSSVAAKGTTGPPTNPAGITQSTAEVPKDYGVFNLEFSVSGTYDNFINFTKDLESNLRIVDISSITFSSDVAASPNGNGNVSGTKSSADVYTYDFKIQTYWLKN